MRKSDFSLGLKEKDDNSSSEFHKPVLLKEVIEFLKVSIGKKYIDCTLGGGGYAFEIFNRGGKVIGIDLDQNAINYVKFRIQNSEFRINLETDLTLVQGNFKDIKKIAHLNNFNKVSGIVSDLGLSSFQIEKSGGGFSFLRDELLDMRMDRSPGSNRLTAEEIVNTWSKEELYELFSKMGEERFALSISNNIVSARKIKPIRFSLQLAEIVSQAIPEKRKFHPATKVFQALRIAVNNELANLKAGLSEGFEILEDGARMVVVSFHSLEDRIIKRYFKDLEILQKGKIITKKPVTATEKEFKQNGRARSAKLRVIERII